MYVRKHTDLIINFLGGKICTIIEFKHKPNTKSWYLKYSYWHWQREGMRGKNPCLPHPPPWAFGVINLVLVFFYNIEFKSNWPEDLLA